MTEAKILINTDVLKDGFIADLGPERWTTLCVLCTLVNGEGEGYPTQEVIAEYMGVTRATTNKRIRELSEFKWKGDPVLIIDKPRDNGQFSTNRYRVSSRYITFDKNNDFAITSFKTPFNGVVLSEDERVLKRSISGYSGWVENVKKFAGYACVKCGSKDNLVSHHKNNYRDFPEERTDIRNGACLCKVCHTKFHSIFGMSGTTSEDFVKFMDGRFE